MQVEVQAHGMGHDLKALVQAAVMLAVDPFPATVADGKELPGAVWVLSGIVNLQLHAKIPGTISIKDRSGLIAVAMDFGVQQLVPAVRTVGIVIIVAEIAGAVIVQQFAAASAAGIVLIITSRAERHIAAAFVVILPDAISAVCAG